MDSVLRAEGVQSNWLPVSVMLREALPEEPCSREAVCAAEVLGVWEYAGTVAHCQPTRASPLQRCWAERDSWMGT